MKSSDIVGSQVRFDQQGDGLGRYNIYNYQKVNGTKGPYAYVKIGKWFGDGLIIDPNKLLWNERSTSVPESVCSHPCQMGEIKIMQQGDRCCWICNPCKDQEFVVNEFSCEKCPDGWWPHQVNKSGCFQLPEQYMRWNSIYALVPVGVSVIGILVTIFVILTFVKYKETPIVKASGRELSFILLGGILFSFLMTFILLAKPSLFICCIQRFGVSFSPFNILILFAPWPKTHSNHIHSHQITFRLDSGFLLFMELFWRRQIESVVFLTQLVNRLVDQVSLVPSPRSSSAWSSYSFK